MSKDFLEHKAFVELFDLHYGNLVGFVYGYVRDEEVAKDFVHDTAVYMGNHSNIFRSSYFYKIEKISAYEISRMCRYKMENEQ